MHVLFILFFGFILHAEVDVIIAADVIFLTIFFIDLPNRSNK